MRYFAAAAVAAATLGGAAAGVAQAQQQRVERTAPQAIGQTARQPDQQLVQQTAPQPGPRPTKDSARDSMPPKQSADAQMSGPAEADEDGRKTARAGEPAERPRADSAIIPDADPSAIVRLAKSGGDARLVADEYGDPLVEAIAGRHPYTVAFFDCTQNRACQSVMFRAGFRARGQTDAQMIGWNREQRFGKAYLDEGGNPVVEFNVNLAGGVTHANLVDSFDRWQAVLADFAEHVGY